MNDIGGHRRGPRPRRGRRAGSARWCAPGEHLARVGGDEFGWILPDADAEGALAAVARARAAIGGEAFRQVGSLTLSGGICVSRRLRRCREIYRRADRALYEAKAAGGDTIRVV